MFLADQCWGKLLLKVINYNIALLSKKQLTQLLIY